MRSSFAALLFAGASVLFRSEVAIAQNTAPPPRAPDAAASVAARPETLSLRDVLDRVSAANPTLQGQRFAVRAADARYVLAGLRPAYDLSAEIEDIFGTDRMSAFGQSQYTLQLSTVIELGGKRAGRLRTAERERDLLLTELDGEKLDVLAEAARRFVRAVVAQRGITLANRAVTLAVEARDAATRRMTAGAGSAAEQKTAEIAVVQAQIAQGRAESTYIQARASLVAMWAGDADGIDVGAELFTLPDLAPLSTLEDWLARSPNLMRFASERRVNEARLRLAETRATPDLSVGAGVRRIQEMRSNAFLLNFSIPLGVGSRAKPYATEARNNLAVTESKERAARAELRAMLAAFYYEARQRDQELQSLRDRAMPLAESARELTQTGFESGRFSLLELLNAQQHLVDLQRAAVAAAGAYHDAIIEIERLTARAIIAPAAN